MTCSFRSSRSGFTIIKKVLSLAAMILLICLASGCGLKRNPISGTVTYKGQPIKHGNINFRSEGKGEYVGTGEIIDGRYAILSISGLPAGKYLVAISYPDPNAPAPKAEEAPGVSQSPREMLPAKYNEKTELKKDITNGPNEVSFDLQ